MSKPYPKCPECDSESFEAREEVLRSVVPDFKVRNGKWVRDGLLTSPMDEEIMISEYHCSQCGFSFDSLDELAPPPPLRGD